MVMTSTSVFPREVRLHELAPKACAVIRRIESEGEDIQRLKTLGICVGRRVEIVRAGDPLIVRVFGSSIGMSAELASHVWLEVCAPPEHCVMKEQSCE
jgi:Fe2+ transport system protein FeoA